MRKTLITLIISVSLLLSLGLPALAATGEQAASTAEWTALYENTSFVTGDLTYTNSIFQTAEGKRVESFALETVAGGSVYPIVVTADSLYEAKTAEELTAALSARGLNILACINADFFYSSVNLPLGGVIREGEYITDLNGEDLFAFTDDGAFFSEKPEIRMTLHNNGGGESSNAGRDVTVDHLNKMRSIYGGCYLYTSDYLDEHLDTTRRGWAVRFRVLSGMITVSGQVELVVEEVLPDCKDIAISDGYMVLTCPADGLYPEGYKDFAVGDLVTLTTVCSDPRLEDAIWATGCGDLLVSGGEITDPSAWDKAISESAHPRTAVGVKPDGSIVALVIDGRSSAYSAGAVLTELARQMQALGCEYAVNLDGGGSSVMMLRIPGDEECTVVNRPSGGSTRACSTYILFVSDKSPDGRAETLHIEEDGRFVLAGSSVMLTPFAADSAGLPADMPEGVVLSAQKGTVVDGIYFAGEDPGADTITIRGENGELLGTGTIHVTDKLDSLTVTDSSTGRAPALENLVPGDTAALAVTGAYMRRDVLMEGAPVEYTVSEGLGEVTPDGSFVASGRSVDRGELTVTAGGITVTIPVKIKVRYRDILDHWAQDYVSTLYDRGIVLKTEDNNFRPDAPMERWEFAMILWRALGSPVLSGECVFTDVPEDSEYYEAVKWGNRIGLIYGTDPDKFSPHDPIDREQSFTLIYRLLTIMRKELPETDLAVLDLFPDGASVSPYAAEAAAALIGAGFVGGSDGYLLPRSIITRAELCKLTCVAVLGLVLD